MSRFSTAPFRGLLRLAFLGFWISWPSPGPFAADSEIVSQTMPNTPQCEVLRDRSWSALERWVWDRICKGELADFKDPSKPPGAEVSAKFLAQVLRDEPWRRSITANGVWIKGALIVGQLDLSRVSIPHSLRLEWCTFRGPVNFKSGEVQGELRLANSVFEKPVTFTWFNARRNVDLTGSEFAKIALQGADIRGALLMMGAVVKGDLDMSGLTVDSQLMLSNSTLSKVFLVAAEIGGQLGLQGAEVHTMLDLGGAVISKGLYLTSSSTRIALINDINLVASKIDGELQITDARISGKLDMTSAIVGQILLIESATFLDFAEFTGMAVRSQIRIENSDFQENVALNMIRVGGDLMIESTEFRRDLDLSHGEYGGTVSIQKSRVLGDLSMNRLQVKSALALESSYFSGPINLIAAEVGGQMRMLRSEFEKPVDMNSLHVARGLYLADGSVFHGKVSLRGARIGEQLATAGARFEQQLDAGRITIGADAFLYDTFVDPESMFVLTYAKIGGTLDLTASKLGSIDLTGATIGGELRLGFDGRPPVNWRHKSALILRNAAVGSFQDSGVATNKSSDAGFVPGWPEILDLQGFTYERLGGLGDVGGNNMAYRAVSWFKTWLERDTRFTYQPYRTLGTALREAGRDQAAEDILYLGRERQRANASGLLWLGLTSIKYVMGYGYGYRNFYVLVWISLFIGMGAYCFGNTSEGRNQSIIDRLIFSFDMLIPIIELDKAHYDYGLGAYKYYFYFHKLVGYVLASVLIGGFSILLS